MRTVRALLAIAFALSLAVPSRADAPGPFQLDLVGGVSAMGAPGERGAALSLGARLALGRFAAVRFDVGYGVMGGSRSLEDRWFLVPSFSAVVPLDRLRLELGFGVGLATASGYRDLEAFVRAPFDDDWAYQLIPTARGLAALWVEVGRDVDFYLQVDAAGLVIEGNDIGLRVGPRNGDVPTVAERFFATLTIGSSVRLE